MAGRGERSTKERREAAGRRLVEMREARDLSQAELCRRSGVSSSQLSQFESGKRDIPRERAIDLIVALDGSLDFLFLDTLDRCPPDLRAEIMRRRRTA